MKFVIAVVFTILGATLSSHFKDIRPIIQSVRMETRALLSMPRIEPKPFFQDTIQSVETTCPPTDRTLTIVAGGQSNAGNYNSAQSKTEASDQVYVFFRGKCYVAKDPVLGADGIKGSLWPLMGASIAKKLKQPVLLIVNAAGGTRYLDWTDPHAPYLPRLKAEIMAARERGYEPSLVLWHQGESDALVERSASEIQSDLQALVDQILAEAPKAQMYLFNVSRCVGPKRPYDSQSVREAQSRLAALDSRVHLGMDTDQLGDDYRWDKCHFNKFGRERIIDMALPKIGELLSAN
ncbi:MAG: hypothetical protein IT552_03625 [Sphingomonadaceae bacterium]|nr:hypothetical protein [Sphingomonadaceae bacterium]